MTENTKDEYKSTYIYPLWNEIQKEINLEEKLTEYVRKILQFSGDEFILDTPILRGFADWMFESYYKQQDGYKKVIANIKKKKELDDLITETKETLHYFVINKETMKVYPSDFGAHWKTVLEVLKEQFGKEYVYDTANWDNLDKYIKTNILLFGNYNIDSSYNFANYERATKSYELLDKNDQKYFTEGDFYGKKEKTNSD